MEVGLRAEMGKWEKGADELLSGTHPSGVTGQMFLSSADSREIKLK